MTRITVLYDSGHITGFTAKGHSGYADRDYDIVCAGVSALTQTAYLGITQIAGAEVDFDQQDGVLRLKLGDKLSEKQREQAELILGTMVLGLSSIEENYSDYLKLIKREVKA